MTNEELERAVERLNGDLLYAGDAQLAVTRTPDLRFLLSERAELLAAVERMRGQVELQKRRVDRRDEKIDRMRAAYNRLLADTDPTSKARAALTTGEGK